MSARPRITAPAAPERLDEARRIRAGRSAEDARRLAGVERYCVFVGQPRSGHSVLGALINAHRGALVSYNLDALAYVRAGLPRDDLFQLILERDRWLAARGRRIGGYAYDVPGAWLGHYEELRVIGDKRAGATSRHLAQEPALLGELPERLGVPVTVIHHVRNPWDNVASIFQRPGIRRERSLAEIADDYFAHLDAAEAGLAAAASGVRLVRVFHEELVEDTETVVASVLAALDLDAEPAFLAACRAFVHPAARRARHDVPWPDGLAPCVGARAEAHGYLAGYAFDGR